MLLGRWIEGSGLGQQIAPDPSAPEPDTATDPILDILAPDPQYNISNTPRKKPETPSMKIHTPLRFASTPNTKNASYQKLQDAVLSAAKETSFALSSPTPIWERHKNLFMTCTARQKLSDKQISKFKQRLKDNPSILSVRAAQLNFVNDGFTLLHACASANNVVVAKILLELDPTFDLLTPDLQGRTALHIAAQYGHVEMIQYLKSIINPAEITGSCAPCDLSGRTPLAWAVTSNKEKARLELFSPGDPSINPVTPRDIRSSKKQDFIQYGYAECPGWRVQMEDCICCSTNLNKDITGLFGVFDGHADMGLVSGYLAENFPLEFLEQLKTESDKKLALEKTCMTLDEKLQKGTVMPMKECGSTAIIALLTNTQVYVANVGDSRAILIPSEGDIIEMSHDHKPNLPAERERIEAAGYTIVSESLSKSSEEEIQRIYKIEYKSQKIGMSRAFGDFDFKKQLNEESTEQALIALPDVKIHQRTEKDKFLVLACDGIWDVMSSTEVGDFIRDKVTEHHSLAEVGDELVKECLYNKNSTDNMSVIIISLEHENIDDINDAMKKLDFN